MQYAKYYKKISVFANILKTIKRYRALILLVMSLAIALTTSYLGIKGHVYSDDVCPSEIVYGEELDYQAKAWFRDLLILQMVL